MEYIICKECSFEILPNKKAVSIKSSIIRSFYKHIEREHDISHMDYRIKHDYNGISPTCACGCGEEVRFTKGVFLKYYSDHKNKMSISKESIQKGLDTKKKNGTMSMKNRLDRLLISDEVLKTYYDDYINYKISMRNISDESGIDRRIIKKYWKELGYIDDIEVFNRISRKHKGIWSKSITTPKFDDYEKIMKLLPDIHKFIISNNRMTLGEIIGVFDIDTKPNFLYKILIENYDYKDIDRYIKFHNSSYAEIEFYNVLKYYFGKKIEKQYKLKDRIYDFKLGDKILIEYDGDYWHSFDGAILNDKYKDELAIDNGFAIFRIKESKSRDIETLLKIKKLYEKINKI